MPSVSNFNMNGTEFAERVMREKEVAIVPGNIFGSYSEDKIRMSYATKFNLLVEAFDRIEKFVLGLWCNNSQFFCISRNDSTG